MRKKILITFAFVFGMFVGYLSYTLFPVLRLDSVKIAKLVDRKSADLIYQGDTTVYRETVDSIRKLTPEHPNYLGMAINMACKNGYVPANFDAYQAIRDIYQLNGLGEMDERTRELAMTFLYRAVDLGDSRALQELDSLSISKDSLSSIYSKIRRRMKDRNNP